MLIQRWEEVAYIEVDWLFPTRLEVEWPIVSFLLCSSFRSCGGESVRFGLTIRIELSLACSEARDESESSREM